MELAWKNMVIFVVDSSRLQLPSEFPYISQQKYGFDGRHCNRIAYEIFVVDCQV